MKSLLIDYDKRSYLFSKKNVGRPSGTYAIVNPDYEQVWNLNDDDGNPVTLKKLDRNSRNEILKGKKQGSGYNAPSGQSVPATARFLMDDFVNFTQDLQNWFHYELNGGKTSEAQAKKDFANCFRDNAWMTNNAGTWTRADYINGNGKPPFVQLQPMGTGSTVLKIVDRIIHKRQGAFLVEAINPADEYRIYSPVNIKHRHLFFRPTNSARVEILDEKGYRIGFKMWYQEPSNSWYGEKMEVPIFGFIRDSRSSTGWCNLIEENRVKVLSSGEPIPNPYIMRDGRILSNPYNGF